jgi:hypothetical protein
VVGLGGMSETTKAKRLRSRRPTQISRKARLHRFSPKRIFACHGTGECMTFQMSTRKSVDRQEAHERYGRAASSLSSPRPR